MIKKLKILRDLWTMEINIFNLRYAINAFANEKVDLILMHGKGDYNVFTAVDQKGQKKFIVKVANKRKGTIAKRMITTRWPWWVYLKPMERFQREANILRELSKRGLSSRLIFFSDKYFIEEYLEGENLPYIISSRKGDEIKILTDVLIAISEIHLLGISHGDLNPSNVFVTDRGVKFIDFEYMLNPGVFTNSQMNAFDYLRFLKGLEELDDYGLIKKNKLGILKVISECLARDKITKDDLQSVISVVKYDDNLIKYFYDI